MNLPGLDCPKTGPEFGLWVESIGGACPCQAHGTIDGQPFYFRARHGEWTLEVSKPGTDPVWTEYPVYFAEGDDPDQGYMSIKKAFRIIIDHLLFRFPKALAKAKKGTKKP